MAIFNGRNYTLADFLPFNYTKIWDQFWSDVIAELVARVLAVGQSLVATSSTNNVAIGTGAKTLTVQTGKGFAVNMWVTATDASNSANSITGPVTSHDPATGVLVMTVPAGGTTGSGTPASWKIGISGQIGATGSLSGGNLTGALNDTSATLASASTVAIGAAGGNYIALTGTTTITAFDTAQAGTERELRHAGVQQLTHNATSLILLTGANITTAVGDVSKWRSEGGGNWRMTSFARANGQPLASALDAEAVQDIVGAMLQAGTGASVVYDDPTGKVTIGIAAYATARYWAVRSSGASIYGTNEAYIGELQMFGTANAGSSDLTTGKTASASTAVVGYEAGKAIDDNTASYWNSAAGDAVKRLSVDLVSPVAVRSVSLQPFIASGHPVISSTVYVEYSTDGSSWTVLATLTIADTTGTQTFINLQ